MCISECLTLPEHLLATSVPFACPALPLTLSQHGAWRELFMQELALRRNWRNGAYRCRALHGHTRSVVSVSVKGSMLASGSLDRSIKLWDLHSGQVLRTLRGHQVRLLQRLATGAISVYVVHISCKICFVRTFHSGVCGHFVSMARTY